MRNARLPSPLHLILILIFLLVFVAAAAVEPAALPANRLPVGGGVIYPAWTGEYWTNPSFEGEPAYTRSDIRIRFDWQDWQPILGVTAESVRDFPTDQFSARWTGQLIARFDEDYTFKLVSDEQARLRIREEGAEEWTTLIDAREPHARRTDTATMALKPGTVYDAQIEFVEGTGDAVCSLYWSSPSTPEEVVDYVAANSCHAMFPHILADLNSFTGKPRGDARPANSAASSPDDKMDENGWHAEDFSYALLQGYSFYPGRGQIAFKGLADVSIGDAVFEVDGKTYETLAKGVGYDKEKNETRAYVTWSDRGDGLVKSAITVSNSQRSPDHAENTGVTELAVMMPRQAGGNEPHEPGEVINQESRDAFLPVYSWRVQQTGLNDIVKWEERTLPSYSRIIGQIWRSDMAYEKLIVAANELGRDLHLNFSGSCDEEFMRNLALLVKYGSDGKDPYTEPTPNPVWPPLSPNLRLYLEHGNEMGWSGIQPRQWSRDYDEIRRNKTEPVWSVLNFDGVAEDDHHFGLMRYHAYRTVRMSENMRDVWGDEAMGDRIRVMLFGQYERWFQNGMMQFIDDYYNNPKYVDDPRPVSHFLWGAGPAVYYGTVNNFIVGDTLYLENGDFEDVEGVGAGEAVMRPEVEGWTLEGGAGIVDLRNRRFEAVGGMSPTGSTRIEGRAAAGFQFTVGDQDIFVYDVGRVAQPGEKGRARTVIVDLDGSTLAGTKHPMTELEQLEPGETDFTHLEYCGWATTDSSRIGVWRLRAGQSYAVVTDVNNVEMPSAESALEPGPGLTIDGGVLVDGATINQRGVGDGLKKVSGPGTGFPIVTFRYAFAQSPAPGMAIAPSDPYLDPSWKDGGRGKSFIPPYHRQGSKALFLAGKGKLSQTFEIEEAGEYALVFTANGSLNSPTGRDGDNRFAIRIGDQEIWNNTVGESRKPNGAVFQWGTRYLPLEAGTHTVTIESFSEDPKDTVYFYTMHLGNMSDFYGGPTAANFLGAGAATGQTDSRFALVAQLCTAEAQLWGLVPYAYEGGTNAGGDWNGGKLEYPNQFKWNHPISKVADNQWAHFWHNYGGANAFYYYPGFEYSYIHKAETFMPWAAAIDRAHTWVLDQQGPEAAPMVFTPDQPHYQSVPASTWVGWEHPFEEGNAYEADTPTLGTERMWKGFVFRAPETADYTITAQTTDGGRAALIVNDSQAVVEGDSGGTLSVNVRLPKGIHAVRVMNLGGTFDLDRVSVQ